MSVRRESLPLSYEMPLKGWIALALGVLIAAYTFHASVMRMSDAWFEREEYSHGILIPFISAFLIWQRWPRIARLDFSGSWTGVALVLAAAVLKTIGDIGTFYILQQYALLILLYGFVLALTGWRVFRELLVPLLILLFMIPLPEFVLQKFSTQLQLVSSQLGVAVIRLFGITVAVEGNVIDLGVYKLQVAEACDGLRYLFPLMTLGFIMAYLFRTVAWKRLVLFASSIPITVLMNSLRIGIIGVTVEHWGIRMAEGVLHEFQGWAVFMVSAALMLAEMILLTRIGADRRPWREVFSLDLPERVRGSAASRPRVVPRSVLASVAVLAGLALLTQMLPKNVQAAPPREPFAVFPDHLASWHARRETLDRIYLDALKLDDYIVANYSRNAGDLVNLYVAWYDMQRAGEAAHSPRACLPAGGWQITELREVELPGRRVGGNPLRVNRVVIEANASRQVVYYWFQQRGRIITNEYVVKWYLFWDALRRGRTDGAMVRLVSPWLPGEDAAAADRRLQDFTAELVPQLERYIPH